MLLIVILVHTPNSATWPSAIIRHFCKQCKPGTLSSGHEAKVTESASYYHRHDVESQKIKGRKVHGERER